MDRSPPGDGPRTLPIRQRWASLSGVTVHPRRRGRRSRMSASRYGGGEVLGIAGVDGNGQRELARVPGRNPLPPTRGPHRPSGRGGAGSPRTGDTEGLVNDFHNLRERRLRAPRKGRLSQRARGWDWAGIEGHGGPTWCARWDVRAGFASGHRPPRCRGATSRRSSRGGSFSPQRGICSWRKSPTRGPRREGHRGPCAPASPPWRGHGDRPPRPSSSSRPTLTRSWNFRDRIAVMVRGPPDPRFHAPRNNLTRHRRTDAGRAAERAVRGENGPLTPRPHPPPPPFWPPWPSRPALLALGGYSPGDAFAALFRGAFGSWDRFVSFHPGPRHPPSSSPAWPSPSPFRARVWNIGAEGQLHAGALAGVGRRGSAARQPPDSSSSPPPSSPPPRPGRCGHPSPAAMKTGMGRGERSSPPCS